MNPIFRFPFRVYFEDTDVGGIVYYANYFKYLERCRTEWLRAFGISQTALMEETGIAFAVRESSATFLKPARLDDEIEVSASILKVTRSQIFFAQDIHRMSPNPDLLLTAQAQVVAIDLAKTKLVSIPPHIKAKLGLAS